MPFAIIAASAEGLGVIASGGDRGIRTPNLCDANAALSQLSYIPARTQEIISRASEGCQDELSMNIVLYCPFTIGGLKDILV